MPMHMEDLDVVSQLEGVASALIVPCRMCPAVSVADRTNRPFMQFFRSLFKSPPLEAYLQSLQNKLKEHGIESDVFGCTMYHQWFMCMWTYGIRKKLSRKAGQYDAVIVLGCNSATVTVADAVEPLGLKVVEGMIPIGIMNGKMRFKFPLTIAVEDTKVVPLEHPGA